MDWPAFADFAIKAGVPTALGCVIVWYLLWKHIPQLVSTHKSFMDDLYKLNEAQRKECKSSIEAMASEHRTALISITADHRMSVEALRGEIAGQTTAFREHLLAESKMQMSHRTQEGAQTRQVIAELSSETRKLAEAIHRQQGVVEVHDNVRPIRSKEKEKV